MYIICNAITYKEYSHKNNDSTVIPLRWTTKGTLIRWQNKTNYLIGLLTEDGRVEMLGDEVDGFMMEASITRDGEHISYNKAITSETFEMNKSLIIFSSSNLRDLTYNYYETIDITPIKCGLKIKFYGSLSVVSFF